jgi:hypothetical protein
MPMTPTCGPLSLCQASPRYFADAAGRPVLLAGLHTWNNLQDMGPSDPPPPLDFDRYLDLLSAHGHTFTRMWCWPMLCTWSERDRVAPFPWPRTGPGTAVDGQPKFDLERLDVSFLQRLKTRVKKAGRRGVYVSVMLFDIWGVQIGSHARRDLHLFAGGNNINGIDILGSERDGCLRAWCTLDDPRVMAIQESYVRQVVETLNDCDNVLYEISNEAGGVSHPWQEHLIAFIREVEAALPAQHLIGQTGGMQTLNRLTYASAADYVAPEANADDGGGRGQHAAGVQGERPDPDQHRAGRRDGCAPCRGAVYHLPEIFRFGRALGVQYQALEHGSVERGVILLQLRVQLQSAHYARCQVGPCRVAAVHEADTSR